MGREDRELVPLGSAFDVVRRGYDRSQVDEHLERVDADLRILAADRDAAVSRAEELTKQLDNQRAQIGTMQSELDRSSAPPTTIEGLSERLARMLRLAQDEAADIRAQAENETAAAIAKAEADAVALRERYQQLLTELDERRVQMEAEHQKVMAKANAEAERLVSETTEEVRKLDEQAAARRRQIEEDFDIAMSSRRTEAMGLLAEQEAASKAEAQRRVHEATAEADRRLREATERARRILGDSQARVDELRSVRAKIVGQLREARSVLAEAALQLEPLPEEEPSLPQDAGLGDSAQVAPPVAPPASAAEPAVAAPAKATEPDRRAEPTNSQPVTANQR